MANICIVCEPIVSDLVKSLTGKLQNNGDIIDIRCQERFPIADAMFSFLWALSSKYDKTFIVMSGERDSILSTWISKELAIQRSLGNFINVYPAFLMEDKVQPWWNTEESFIILPLL